MLSELREKIERALAASGEVEYNRRSHHRRGPQAARVLPEEDPVHEKGEIVRKGKEVRIHYVCSNEKCQEAVRSDKWDDHVLRMSTDLHLQESPREVLERSMNFSADGLWVTREMRQNRVVTFMEQRPRVLGYNNTLCLQCIPQVITSPSRGRTGRLIWQNG